MPTALITGANRGLGLEFARQYAADGWRVIATARDPGRADDLRTLDGEVRIEQLEMTEFDRLDSFTERLDGELIDLFIANAGMMGTRAPLGEINGYRWVETLSVNTVAPTLLASALLGRMSEGGKLIAVTSKMGSIADNQSGGSIVYRSSKAALNAAWRSLAIDLKGRFTVAMLHPGWVQTDMGGPSALITPEESIASMRGVIESLTSDKSGAFLNYDGGGNPLVGPCLGDAVPV
jgi:NAD(P)-dependent dehydrogenase (short-subunit alcohol dehydrogenase family)